MPKLDKLDPATLSWDSTVTTTLYVPLNISPFTAVEAVVSVNQIADWVGSVSTLGGVACQVGDAQLAAGNYAGFSCFYVPPACTIQGIHWTVKGGTGHAGTPGTAPALSVYKTSITGAPTLIDTKNDTAVAPSPYENIRTLITTGLSTAIDPTVGEGIMLRVLSEYGANAKSFYRIASCALLVQLSEPFVMR